MDLIGGHFVHAYRLIHLVDKGFQRHPEIVIQSFGVGNQTGKMLLNKSESTIVQAETFLNTIAY